MSILKLGNALFQTHVQLEDVQHVIEEQMSIKSKIGKDAMFTDIGDGNGFMSRVILVERHWTVPNKTLSDKFVLKITSAVHLSAFVEQMKQKSSFGPEQKAAIMAMVEGVAQAQHNREVNFYEIAEKWNKNDVLLMPKTFFSLKFDAGNKTKGILGMEYVSDTVVRHLNCNVKPQELCPVLKALATLQAEGLHLTDQEAQSISGYDIQQMMGPMLTEDGMKGIFEQLISVNPDRLASKAQKIGALGAEIVNFELAGNLNKYVGIKRAVLVHGDLWSANLLWNEENGKFSVNKIIDYQLIHMGNPAEDLVRLFLTTLSGADRQANWESLLETFYKYFQEALGSNKNPYSLEQLKDSYRHYFVTGALLVMPLFGTVAQMKLATADPKHASEYREVITEKAEHLLDDVERWHQFSKDLVRNHTD